jgi:hypothetical protein
MAILNMVFGGLVLACSLCAGIGILLIVAAFNQAAAQDPKIRELKEVIESMTRHIPSMVPFMVGNLLFSAIVNIILIVAGIGLLKMHGWARITSIFCAVATILEQIASLVYRFTVVNPGVEAWQREFLARHPGAAMQENPFAGNAAINSAMEVFGTLVQMAYAIALLIVMLLPTVAAAFRAPPAEFDREQRDDRDEDQYDRGDPWRQEPPPR